MQRKFRKINQEIKIKFLSIEVSSWLSNYVLNSNKKQYIFPEKGVFSSKTVKKNRLVRENEGYLEIKFS